MVDNKVLNFIVLPHKGRLKGFQTAFLYFY